MTYNRLLLRQIQKHLPGASIPEEFKTLLQVISDSYNHYESDRLMLERSMDLSSDEMIELNGKLRNESQALRIINERLNEAQKIALLGSWEWDVKANKVTWSDELYKIFEITPAEFTYTYESCISFVHPEDKKFVDDIVTASLDKGAPFSYEARIITRNGVVKSIYSEGKALKNEAGEIIKLFGIAQDITERKHAETILKESEERYRNIIEESHELIQSVGTKGEFLFVNTEWKNVMGYGDDEIVTLNAFDIIAEESKETCAQEFGRLMLGESLKNIEAVFKTKDGKKIFVEGNAVPRFLNGKVIGTQGFFRDITERKAAQEALLIKNTELEKANSALDKFVYSVSHDLRAPLTSMMGVIEISESITQEDVIREQLGMIKGSIKKLDGFILDILAYSRNSRMEVKKVEIDFKEILHEISDNLKFMGSNNRVVDIKYQVKNGVPFRSDRTRLLVVLNNLISNSIRYQNPKTDSPFVDVNVHVSNEEVLIRIEDNGIGISQEHQPKIFDMFYRVSENSVGSGLGLHIVKETIEKLNGRIKVESELGKGTVFNIHIPNN